MAWHEPVGGYDCGLCGYLTQVPFDGRQAHPGFYVSHNLGLDEAPEAYRHFDNRDEGWTKVVLNPTKG
jgi:hypothetical protein